MQIDSVPAPQKQTMLEFVNGRAEIAEEALKMMRARLAEHRIDIEEVLMGTPREASGKDNVEKLLDQLRQRQTAEQQTATFEAQGVAADAKRALNEKLAVAEQQSSLTASKIAIDVAKNEGQARSARAAEEANGIKVTADADAYAIKAKGDAQAHASKATSEAVGGPDNLMRQFALTSLSGAIAGSKHKLVPHTVLTGSDGGGASLIDAFLAMSIGGKAPTQPNATGLIAKPPAA